MSSCSTYLFRFLCKLYSIESEDHEKTDIFCYFLQIKKRNKNIYYKLIYYKCTSVLLLHILIQVSVQIIFSRKWGSRKDWYFLLRISSAWKFAVLARKIAEKAIFYSDSLRFNHLISCLARPPSVSADARFRRLFSRGGNAHPCGIRTAYFWLSAMCRNPVKIILWSGFLPRISRNVSRGLHRTLCADGRTETTVSHPPRFVAVPRIFL